MGLMHATKKRRIISWSISIGVAFIVAVVKRLPYPWRSIVDAGVVTGLVSAAILDPPVFRLQVRRAAALDPVSEG